MSTKFLSEFIGTFFLVFFGTGAIIFNEEFNQVITHLGVSLAFGVSVTLMIYSFGSISGAHINPAVSVAFFLSKKINFSELCYYIVAQIAGGISASLILYTLFPENLYLGATLPHLEIFPVWGLEFIMSFFLMLVIIQVSTNQKYTHLIGIAVGLIVFLEALVGGPISGASMNPARSLGPAIVSGHTEFLWIYITSPVLGMITALYLTQFINTKN